MNDRLQNALAALADKLGTTVEHLWAVLIKQAKVELITDVGTFLLAVVLVWLLLRFWFWIRKKYEHDITDAPVSLLVGGILVSVFVGIFAIVAVVNAFDIPTLLFNPEYWALSQISGLIK